MNASWKRTDIVFMILCTLLGVLAEQSFFHSKIGISYFVFVTALYWTFFWRFKGFDFTNRRFGFFVLLSIWLLSSTFFLYSNMFFYGFNQLVIPVLVIFHMSLITGNQLIPWHKFSFIFYTLTRFFSTFPYVLTVLKSLKSKLKPKTSNKTTQALIKVTIGLLLSVPLLFVVILLLSSADEKFKMLVGNLPDLLIQVNPFEGIFRTLAVLIISAVLFGYLQVLKTHRDIVVEGKFRPGAFSWDPIIVCTLLLMVNAVYVLFASLQFQYFFSGTLQESYTFAEYARRGFFELLAVTLINLSLLNGVITFTHLINRALKAAVKLLLTLLIIVSGIMLVSAFVRLSLYESAYGFTFDRVLPHSFMLLLAVIFIFTLIKVWVERLSLVRFYVISALVYYTALNMVNVDQFIVNQNMQRYEETGKIDLNHLTSLSYAGLDGLMDLYEKEPSNQKVKQILLDQKIMMKKQESWQSFNLLERKVSERLENLSLY
ncbi:DUF4153 domain-containing protein [Fictibacillus aquaticus]|uniref:Uncharacterized protein n=1 Tax=Fictibacillus aquaticus TaxID=2021314 RepID=A0A235F5R1_9BACL|nr:DUF4173 domain-containing protein [Fictibacillus aquaticus]OYD56636.1 hypothetical protein CGZ90_16635 [Fictibacillus aquaticus]